MDIGSNYNLNVKTKDVLQETLENYNDIGIMQAINNLTALQYVVKILEDNQLVFNTKKIILFVQSQGAYLSHLCNALAPNVFSLLIDNSVRLFPEYLNHSRFLTNIIGKMTLQIEFEYLASKFDYDKSFLNLSSLYQLFENKCEIVCYLGTTDTLVTHGEKKLFCDEVPHCKFYEINSKDVDGIIFKSTNHGLDTNFFNFFANVMEGTCFTHSKEINTKPLQIKTEKTMYNVCYERDCR